VSFQVMLLSWSALMYLVMFNCCLGCNVNLCAFDLVLRPNARILRVGLVAACYLTRLHLWFESQCILYVETTAFAFKLRCWTRILSGLLIWDGPFLACLNGPSNGAISLPPRRQTGVVPLHYFNLLTFSLWPNNNWWLSSYHWSTQFRPI